MVLSIIMSRNESLIIFNFVGPTLSKTRAANYASESCFINMLNNTFEIDKLGLIQRE
jgi:hypothetical protein